MIRGLQISVRGRELSQKIAERVRVHESAVAALDARIKERAGDKPFDVRVEDDFKSLADLETERQQHKDRLSELTLLRDNLLAGEIYALSRADLRLAELISAEVAGAPEAIDDYIASGRNAIEGLKLTIPGEEVKRLLEQRMHRHRQCAERWNRERERTPEQQTEEQPLLPDHMCENEAERHEWRIEVLGFIRDHIDPDELYRLGESDLAFGELLPQKPGWLEQQEHEERTAVGFNLERLTKTLGRSLPREFSLDAKLVGDAK